MKLFVSVTAIAVFLLTSNPDADAKRKRRGKSKIGDYDGIKAGQASIRPPGARKKGRRGARIYWIGFQQQADGSSRFFIQIGKEAEVEQWLDGGNLVVHLSATRIGNRTVQRYLDTRYFDTAIQTLRTKQVRQRKAKGERRGYGRGVQLTFAFKNAADIGEAGVSVTTEADGFSYVYLDFAKGTDSRESVARPTERLTIDE